MQIKFLKIKNDVLRFKNLILSFKKMLTAQRTSHTLTLEGPDSLAYLISPRAVN